MRPGELAARLLVWRRAGLKLVIVRTDDEMALRRAVDNLEGDDIWQWSQVQGLRRRSEKLGAQLTRDPETMLQKVLSLPQGLVVAYDLSAFWDNPGVTRALREIAQGLPPMQIVVVTSGALPIPAALQRVGLEVWLDPESASPGLPLTSLEDQWSKSPEAPELGVLVRSRLVRGTPGLEWVEPGVGFDEVGGLNRLKQWAERRKLAWDPDSALPWPRGLLLFGMPGTGKSLSAKALAAYWNIALLRLNVGQLFASYVGQSEAQWQWALAKAEELAPVVLWVDELEKVLAGQQSSHASDAGTTSRALGYFLTWLEEHQRPVVVVATANEVEQLPPELLRRGRFDALFFVDLPDEADRKAILDIHLRNQGISTDILAPADWELLLSQTEDFSGAELKDLVTEARFVAATRQGSVSINDFVQALREMVPLAKSMKESLASRRAWAIGRGRRA